MNVFEQTWRDVFCRRQFSLPGTATDEGAVKGCVRAVKYDIGIGVLRCFVEK